LLNNFTPVIESFKLIPSSGGKFEVMAGDTLVYSKKAEGRHVEEGELLGLFQQKLGVTPTPRE
jgi:selenoprotein W-related protein